MDYVYWILGIGLAGVWLHRVVDAALGMPGIADISAPVWDRRVEPGMPRVSVVVPARNEADHIEAALRSLLALEYPDFEIIAVNDRSTDGTGQVMERVAALPEAGGRLKVLHIQELPSGWLGKVHAMWRAASLATGEWILFTDADVVFRSDSLRRAMAFAQQKSADHLVLFPTVVMKTVGERMMLAFFNLLFVFGHRPWKVADPKARDHIGIGAFNLVRASAYRAVGTHQALRLYVIDDMHLGRLMKEGGYAQRSVFGPGLLTLRWAQGAMGVVENLTKNFFALMLFRWPRTLGSALLLTLLHLGPFAGVWLAPGAAKLGYGVSLLCIFALYVGMWTRVPILPYYFFLHPVSSVLFVYILLRSMIHAWRNGGVVWRGTRYPLEELRRAVS